MAVEPRLFALLELAVRVGQQSGGAYDITAGPLWEVWGFARRAGAVPPPEQLAAARRHVGSHLIELDARAETVRFLDPGVQAQLGQHRQGLRRGSLRRKASGCGHRGFSRPGGQQQRPGPWRQRAAAGRRGRPRRPLAGRGPQPLPPRPAADRDAAEQSGLGTSGTQFQSFRHQGRRYGHILDPRSGWPAEGVLLATALAPTATLADALSTAFYVLGPKAALGHCRQHPEIAALVVCPAARGDGLEIHSAGLEK